MNFYIHHPGKAGEVFMGLPMARLLKTYHPDSKITWVVLDLYRDSVGNYPYIDEVETIPSYSCSNLSDVAGHMSKHRYYACHSKRWVEDPYGIHIDAYYNYMLYRLENNRFRLHRDPFYIQLFKNATYFCPDAHEVDSWLPPEWYPTEQAIIDGETFQKQFGGGPVIIFSPYVADKSCVSDNQSSFDMHFIYDELRKWNLPVVATGTKWDTKDFPPWVLDGYSPTLSLGGLFYLLQNRAALVVSPNSGIGFAAHWLGAPVLMIDNRTGWKDQVEVWRKKVPILDDQAFSHENRWPPFLRDNFHTQHLLPVPFEQIEWNRDGFLQALTRIKLTTANNTHEACGKVRATPQRQPAILQPTGIEDYESQRTVCVPERSTIIEEEKLSPFELPRLVVFDITRRSDKTATGELKATLFHGWPEHRFLQIYSTGQDLIGADGGIPGSFNGRLDQKLEEVSYLVRTFAPEMLLYRPTPDNMKLHMAAMETIRSSTLPLAVWIMDDWPSRLSVENPNVFIRLDADLRELFARAELRLSICDAMSKAFAERYKLPFKAFANAIDPNDWPSHKRDNRQGKAFMLRYAGSLAENMTLDSVLRTAHAVELLGDKGVNIHFQIKTQLWWVQRAAERFYGLKRTSISMGNLSSDAYRIWLSEADALLIAYNFDAASKNYIRYSFANKLPECLASGSALIAHGPIDVSTIKYINELNCAIVVPNDDEEELASAIKALVRDPYRQRCLAEKARAIAFSAHNVHRVRHAFRSELVRVAGRKRLADVRAWCPEYERNASAHVDETSVVSMLSSAVTDGERIMIDVGAHFGSSAQHFVRKGWKIYCFEPDAANRERLVAKFSDTPDVIIDPREVSEKAEKGKPFFASPESTGISALHAFRETHKQTALADVTTIAEIVEDYQLTRIDFLKIDAEGFDFAVLRGVPWEHIKPAVIECEFEDAKTVPLGHTWKDVSDFLVAKGYTVYVSEWHPIVRYGIQHDWCRLFKYPGPLRDPQGWGNLLAFLEDPGTEAIAEAVKTCVKVDHPRITSVPEKPLPLQGAGALVENTETIHTTSRAGRTHSHEAPVRNASECSVSDQSIEKETPTARVKVAPVAQDREPVSKKMTANATPQAGWYRRLVEGLTAKHLMLRPFFRFFDWSTGAIARHWLGVTGAVVVTAILFGTAMWFAPALWPYGLTVALLLISGGMLFLCVGYGQHFFSRYAEQQVVEIGQQAVEVVRLHRDIGRLRHEIASAVSSLSDIRRRLDNNPQLNELRERCNALDANIATQMDAVRSRQDALDRAVTAQVEEAKQSLTTSMAAAVDDVRAQTAALKTMATEALDAVRSQDSAFRKLNASNASLARPFNRFLSTEQIRRLQQHWSKVFGVAMSPVATSYLAHRMCLAEDQCEGRVACSIETAMLRQYALRSLKGDQLDVLEIGTLFGLGAAFLYKFAGPEQSTVRLTLIDPLEGYYGNHNLDPATGIPVDRRTLEANYKVLHIPSEDWRLIQRLSTDPVAAQEAADRQYDLILIDGDHSVAGVARDYEMYGSMVKPGGLIIFDDYGSAHWPSIKPFVDEHVRTDGRWIWMGAEWNTAILRRGYDEAYVHAD